MFNRDALAEVKARRAIRELTALNISVPQPVKDQLDQLDTLAAAAPKHPGDQALIEATIAGDPDQIMKEAIALATHEHRQRAHAAAVQRAGAAVSAALRANRKPIVDALTEQAQQAANRVAAARNLGDTTVESLVLAGRHDDASLLAAVGANRQVFRRLVGWADRNLGQLLPVSDPDSAPE
ncbi:hypothetical protein AWC02_14940 [Mycolicibacter engbaekii]|uniref:Uncharacterized protein n=1 Tax=Mycolicibacter engbaekii TaxID=188915 RepID=A0A1X1TJ42_9MYCO|nr:hypothetical protein [Mycolicibacter engbaekii]ORV44540.1 hypothetical protein AWC02_14940 [Mycolicibacter engbaekii]